MNDMSSLLRINRAITSKEFFFNSVIIFVFQAIAVIIYYILYFLFKNLLFFIIVFGILSLLPFMYLHFVNCAKRIWNIWAINKSKSIMITILLFIMAGFGIYFFPLFLVILYLLLIFLPERKND